MFTGHPLVMPGKEEQSMTAIIFSPNLDGGLDGRPFGLIQQGSSYDT